jgi:hypothetical protein
MTTYRIYKDYWSTYKNFNSTQDCEAWILANLGSGYNYEVSPEQIPEPTQEERLENDKQFGVSLIDKFLVENRYITPSITDNESLTLLYEFSDIERLARLGNIKGVKALMENIQVDARLFTQQRKDEYLQTINSYLQQ